MAENLLKTESDNKGIGWLLLTMALTGMGWGIRGQYGHETGAMIAGVLAGFTLVLFYLPEASSLRAA